MSYFNDFEAMLLATLDAILARYDRNPAYHFIDTKLDLLTGKDFGPEDAWYKQPDIIFPWIQGRGLEAMAGHLEWVRRTKILTRSEKERRIGKIRRILTEVSTRMEKLRRKNHGRMYFLMTIEGDFLAIGPDGGPVRRDRIDDGANFSDLFYAKGLFAAGAALGDDKLRRRGENYLKRVVRDILAEKFVTDQQVFDPKNPVQAVPGKLLQGPKMIALDGTAIGMKHGDPVYWERRARALLKRIFSRYIALGEVAKPLAKYDFWESVDPTGKPWDDRGKLLADPGHELEFIGLSLKNLLHFTSPAGLRDAAKFRKIYGAMLEHYFGIGFAPGPGGIVKSYDLRSRQVVNSDMPWWSLPETIRAAALTSEFTGETARTGEIMRRCAAAFLNGYVRPELNSMAVQTRNARGEVVPVIPATPDADPGYHTNLSIIDALPALHRLD